VSTLNTAEFGKSSPVQQVNNNKMFFSNDFGQIPKPPNANNLDFGKLRDATPLDLMKNNHRNNYNRTTLAWSLFMFANYILTIKYYLHCWW